MKKLFLLLFAAGLALPVVAQPADDLLAAAVDRERQRINSERVALEAKFDAEEALCYKKFFVNSCLNDIKPQRREAMTELRQREVALGDQKRKLQAAGQIRKTEEKSSLEVQQQAAERRAKALQDTQQRQERSEKKADERIDMKQNESINAAEAASKAKGAAERAQTRAEKKAAVADEVVKYNEKQQEVMERKASREKQQREQTKPPAKPLPAPQ